MAGKINDLAWDGESKRMIAVGDGKDKFGHAFLVDTGSSVGEITGHSKSINSVSIRPTRPIRGRLFRHRWTRAHQGSAPSRGSEHSLPQDVGTRGNHPGR